MIIYIAIYFTTCLP